MHVCVCVCWHVRLRELIIKSDRFELEDVQTKVYKRKYMYGTMDTIVKTAYAHAPVLIDANTLDEINTKQCFGAEFDHICKLDYWETDFKYREDLTEAERKVRFRRKFDSESSAVYGEREIDYPHVAVD